MLALLLALLVPVAALGADDAAPAATPSRRERRRRHAESAQSAGRSRRDLAIWTAVVFLVLLLVLWKFAWGPIAEGLDKREQGDRRPDRPGRSGQPEGQGTLADYEQKLAAAQDEVRGILDQGRRDAEQVGREMLDKAKARGQGRAAAGRAADRRRHDRRHEGTGRPQRHAGRRAGRQDRPRQAQPGRPRPADRAGRGRVRRKANGASKRESQ